MSIDPSSILLLKQNSAWYKPSAELEKFYTQVEKSEGDAAQKEVTLDQLRSMFDPLRYDENYLTEDINLRTTHEEIREQCNQGKELSFKIQGHESKNPYLLQQMQYYQTLQAIQAMFRLGVENDVIKENHSPKGGIALDKIDSSLPANLKMGWLLSQKYGEDSSIGIRDENTGESVSVTLRDTRSSKLHGKDMLKALTDPSKANFLVRLATKKNINDPSAAAWKLHPNSVLQVNNDYLMRGINVTIKHDNEFTDEHDFLPPREEFDF